MNIQVGGKVKAVKMASDSFYKQVIGSVTEIRNGFASIQTTEVMDKWSKSFVVHSCTTAAKLADVVLEA